MVRTRFAPSPTGYMHIGGMRTALYNYLFAKQAQGSFILRIEDTDLNRLVLDATELIYYSLDAGGIIADESPIKGGNYAPYIQSERKEIYAKAAKELVERGGAYYCFCTKERIDNLHAKGATKYDKKCLELSKEEVKRRIEAGEPYVIRQNIPSEGATEFNDLVFGKISIEHKELEDGVLLKSDGMPTYNFANVVDDHYMEISHVIRGSEYLSSTPKYILIYEAMGWQSPIYAHLQPIMKNEREKLSKRHGAPSFEGFIEKGYLNEAVVNYIALLGWSPKDEREKLSMAEMLESFSLSGVSKSPSIFDEAKLRWLNGLYIKEMPFESFHKRACERYKELSYLNGLNLTALSKLLHTRIEVFSDIHKQVEFINNFAGYDLSLFENAKNKVDKAIAKDILIKTLDIIQNLNTTEGLFGVLSEFFIANSIKKGAGFWALRIAVSGASVTCGGATELIEVLGKEESVRRIKESIERLNLDLKAF